MEKDYKKQLSLKYKSVQRLQKEYNSYLKEIEKLDKKVATLQESQAEEYDINKIKESIRDTTETINVVTPSSIKLISKLCNQSFMYLLGR